MSWFCVHFFNIAPLVRRLIRIVKVINVNKIEIQFQSGIVMEQRVDFEE